MIAPFAVTRPAFAAIGLACLLAPACRSAEPAPAPSQSPQPSPTESPRAATVTGNDSVPEISDDPVIQRVVELGLVESRVDDHAAYLTQTIGPRLTSSHALMDAERWARDRFAEYGLDSRLEWWGNYPVGFDRGPASGGMVHPERIDYVFATPAWSPGIFGPARGRAVEFPRELRRVERDPDFFEGKWIVVARPSGDPGLRLDREEQKKIGEALDDIGVLGFIASDQDAHGELVHTSGRKSIEWGALPDRVRINLRADQFDDLLARVRSGLDVELEFGIDNRFFRGPVPQYNVIADIRGSELPDEYVIIGGHLDSWDGSEGAVDNATGVATSLEAARILQLAGARPRRTIRFMLWSGEEQGLFGSRAYVNAHPELLDKISAVLVHDGGTNYLSGLSVTPEMHAQFEPVVAPLRKLAPQSRPFELYLTDHLRSGSSDHDSFLALGVPGFFWHQSGRSNYHCMHHTQLDNYEMINDEYQRHSSVVVALTALGLANLPDLLERERAIDTHRRKLAAKHDWATIRSVEKGGPAHRAGLRADDVITAVDGKPVRTSYRVRRFLNAGGPVKKLAVRRKKRKFEVTLDFSNDPSEIAAEAAREARKAEFGPDIYERIAARSPARPTRSEDCAAEVERQRHAR